MRLVVTLLLLAINSFPARASVLLLQSAGADVGDCRQTACLSLSYAISQVQPLDIIRISAGIFTGSLNRNLNPGSLGKSNFTVEGPIVQLSASWGIVAICCYKTSSEAFSQQDLQDFASKLSSRRLWKALEGRGTDRSDEVRLNQWFARTGCGDHH